MHPRVTSTITISHKGDMTMFRKHKHKHRKKEPKVKEKVSNGSLDESSRTSSDDEVKFKSTAHGNRNGFFHGVESRNAGITQNVKVEVNIDQKDDCLTSCFSALGACFGKGSALRGWGYRA